jgi:hypothetical protein
VLCANETKGFAGKRLKTKSLRTAVCTHKPQKHEPDFADEIRIEQQIQEAQNRDHDDN